MAGAQRQEEAALRQLEVFWNDAAARRADEVAKRIKKHEAELAVISTKLKSVGRNPRNATSRKQLLEDELQMLRGGRLPERSEADLKSTIESAKVRIADKLKLIAENAAYHSGAARLSAGSTGSSRRGGPAAPREVPRPVGDGQALGAGHSEVRDSHIDDEVVGKGYNRVPPAVQAFVTETLHSLKKHGLWGRLDGACTHAHTYTHPT